jgi:glycogen(starch) synthase
MNDLRVAVVARAVMPLHGVGGLERSVHDLVRHLAARGISVTLIVPPGPAVRHTSAIDPFASPLVRVRHVSYLTFPFANRKGTTVIDRSTSYLLYGWRAGRLALAMARSRDIDIIHGFGASILGAARSDCPVPVVLNPQGLEEFGATSNRQPTAKRLGYGPLRWAVKRVARHASSIIATDHSLESTVDRHLHPSAGQMTTIPNGLDLTELSGLAGPADGPLRRRKHGIGSGEFVLLSVGRLEFNKGFDLLSRALAKAAAPGSALAAMGWRWVIVGAGPFRPELERQIAQDGIASHVLFAGKAPDRELHAWYEAASVFVHPTRYEGSSIVTLEAMAHRRAVIATRAGGLPDKVIDGETGWLVLPENPEELARAITAAASDPSQLRTLGIRGRDLVEREFAWPVLAARTEALYRRLLQFGDLGI